MVLPTAWTEDGRPWKVLMGWLVRKDARLRKDARARQSSASAGTGCLHFGFWLAGRNRPVFEIRSSTSNVRPKKTIPTSSS